MQLEPPPALSAYEALAPHYDAFTRDHEYERWLSGLEAVLLEHGLCGREILDVACGSGKSFLPLARRGYRVTACDISPQMVTLARRKLGGRAANRVFVADMRSLPRVGEFNLITCLGDSVNYLLDEVDLDRFVIGAAANLAAGGLLVFDVNTLRTYRTAFASTSVMEAEGSFLCWRGHGTAEIGTGSVSSATIDTFAQLDGDLWERRASRHVQRHHAAEVIERALRRAELGVRTVLGQHPGARLETGVDEEVHHKAVYIVAHAQEGGATT